MSAMTKHIGSEIDFPSMGSCVGGPEIGYLYGQVIMRKHLSLDEERRNGKMYCVLALVFGGMISLIVYVSGVFCVDRLVVC